MLALVSAIYQVGEEHRMAWESPGVPLFWNLLDEYGKPRRESLDLANDGMTNRELLARYAYLLSVLEQGPDMTGIDIFFRRLTEALYASGIKFLHDPRLFFANLTAVVELVETIHKQVRKERSAVTGIRAYSLYDARFAARPIPFVCLRFGSPLLALERLQADGMGLLDWIRNWSCANDVVDMIKHNDRYGLGRAIGDKACRLFIKLVIHTLGLIEDSSPKWNSNSFEIPLDSNVGRVLMRTGIVLTALDLRTFTKKCCTEQANGRINLNSNKLREVRVEQNHPAFGVAIRKVREWYPSRRSAKFPILLNALLDELARRDGAQRSIGTLDDAMMHIGTVFCLNSPREMDCNHCPLSSICYANNECPSLKEQYYCGEGEGTFY